MEPEKEPQKTETDELEEVFNRVCPNVLGNPFIPHTPFAAQAVLLGAHLASNAKGVFRALYGGAAGGGKSDALLMAAAQYAWKDPNFSGILFRRTHTDLSQPGALLDRAHSWWSSRGVRFDGTNKIFVFPSGAKVAMAYLDKPLDHLRYQSAEYQFTGWDELTQWASPAQFEYVGLSRVRRSVDSATPLRTLGASNPGGPGHVWVRDMFVSPNAPCMFIPSFLTDNPFIDQEAYMASLEWLNPVTRAQLLNGEWDVREPGDYFRREWFGMLLEPEDRWARREATRIRWWDLAASEKVDSARTAGVLMARHRAGVRAVEHAVAFRATPGRRDDMIVQQARADGYHVTVGLEIEGGSGGIAQFDSLEKRLKQAGFRVTGARPKVEQPSDIDARFIFRNPTSLRGKEGRADPVAACAYRGYQRRGEGDPNSSWYGFDMGKEVTEEKDGIRLYAGAWNNMFLDELEAFPEKGVTCDLVDAMSGAWAWLETHSVSHQTPIRKDVNPAKPSYIQDLHPADRDAKVHYISDYRAKYLRPL